MKRNVRKVMKKKLIKKQGEVLFKKMMKESKCDGILFTFKFNGCMMKYLTELPFNKAQIIFKFGARMFPTKSNFPNRWKGTNCIHCGKLETDEHLFSCIGYSDILSEDLSYKSLFTLDAKIPKLHRDAEMLQKVYNRLETLKENE